MTARSASTQGRTRYRNDVMNATTSAGVRRLGSAAFLRSVLGEGGRLSEPRPARSGQLPPQVLDLPLLTLVLALQAVDLTPLTIVLAVLVLGVALAASQLRAEPFDLGLQVLVRVASWRSRRAGATTRRQI